MAELEKIRKRSGILIIVIGLAMAAFILTDLLNSGGSVLNGDRNTVGKVNGEKITIQDFNARLEDRENQYKQQTQDFSLQNISRKQLADAVWNDILREKLMDEEYEKLGIRVTAEELYARIIENPNIRTNQSFIDPATGQFSESLFKQAIANLKDNSASDERMRDIYLQWLDFEKGMREQAYISKYNKAVELGIYYPEALVREDYYRTNQSITAQYVQLPYAEIADSTVEVTDAEINAYVKQHAALYEQEEPTRNLTYVSFAIEASEEDRNALRQELEALKADRVVMNEVTGMQDTLPGFVSTKNDSSFVAANSDQPYDNSYYKQADLGTPVDSIAFALEVGEVYGPFEDGQALNLMKVVKRISLPDSVKARHILLAFQGAERAGENVTRTPMEAKQLADSLFAAIKDDRSLFESVSSQYSDDQVAKMDGGSLGWFNDRSMAPAFSNYCFWNKTGDLGLVITNFGFHIIEIMDQKGGTPAVRLARVVRMVNASDKTMDAVYLEANNFASSVSSLEEFGSQAEAAGLSARPVMNLKPFDEMIPGLGMNREMVRWAHNEETQVGDIRLFAVGTSSYIVAQLSGAREAGLPEAEAVRDQVEPLVIKQKKAETLRKRIEDLGAANLADLASKLGQQPRSQAVTFSMVNLAGAGNEPKVVGWITGMPQGKMSPVIEGELGVYVVEVNSVLPVQEPSDLTQNRTNMLNQVRPRVATQMFESIKKGARIKDNRATFF